MTPLVAKVGGSLFDLPDLKDRLRGWLVSQGDRPVILVPGGGRGADVIRQLDATHRLGEETAHWLALGVLTVNARFLAGLLDVPVVDWPTVPGRAAVLDAFAFCRADEGNLGAVAHSWSVTSDTVAARAAAVAGGELVLLKSTDRPAGTTWAEAAGVGLVDAAFPALVAGLSVSWVNLRAGVTEQSRGRP